MIPFRASSVGKLMAYPEKDTIPEGALSHIYEIASQILLDWKPDLSTPEIEKGNVVEDQSIALLNQVTGNFYVKNKTRITTDLFTGEWDIDEQDEDIIIDIKSAYSKKTFPIEIKAGDKKLYEWQLDNYMLIRDLNRSAIAYTLVDTPDYLIKKYENIDWHVVGHIPPERRVTMFYKERDATREKQLIRRAKICQELLCEILDKKGFKFEVAA